MEALTAAEIPASPPAAEMAHKKNQEVVIKKEMELETSQPSLGTDTLSSTCTSSKPCGSQSMENSASSMSTSASAEGLPACQQPDVEQSPLLRDVLPSPSGRSARRMESALIGLESELLEQPGRFKPPDRDGGPEPEPTPVIAVPRPSAPLASDDANFEGARLSVLGGSARRSLAWGVSPALLGKAGPEPEPMPVMKVAESNVQLESIPTLTALGSDCLLSPPEPRPKAKVKAKVKSSKPSLAESRRRERYSHIASRYRTGESRSVSPVGSIPGSVAPSIQRSTPEPEPEHLSQSQSQRSTPEPSKSAEAEVASSEKLAAVPRSMSPVGQSLRSPFQSLFGVPVEAEGESRCSVASDFSASTRVWVETASAQDCDGSITHKDGSVMGEDVDGELGEATSAYEAALDKLKAAAATQRCNSARQLLERRKAELEDILGLLEPYEQEQLSNTSGSTAQGDRRPAASCGSSAKRDKNPASCGMMGAAVAFCVPGAARASAGHAAAFKV